ncbi:hypothetical protein BGX29_009016 [Mortierella sp. GBA35]|nr:hypothetical protein BGX29_009016 [Mortierella sp. GBA35]
MDSLGPGGTVAGSSTAGGSSTTSNNNNTTNSRKTPAFRNLQPRAAARMDFNDDSDDEDGILSADYIAERKTTQDLVDFFKSGPPPSPPRTNANLPPIMEDEKKKKPLLQWLRPKKSGSSLNGGVDGSALGTASGRNSVLVQGTATSNMSTVSGVTMGKGKNGEDITTSILPNGRKYVMIAVDYKEGEDGQRSAGSVGSDALGISNGSYMATTRLPNGGTASSRRASRVPDDVDSLIPGSSKRMSILSSTLGSDLGLHGGEKRRSILQTSTTDSNEGFKSVLGGGSFLLENFALGTDFMGQGGSSAGGSGGSGGFTGTSPSELQRSPSTKSGAGGSEISRTGSKRGNKVKFDISGDPNASGEPMDESVVAEALAERLASHKAQQQGKAATITTTATTTTDGGSSSSIQEEFPDIILPKLVSRKKVRHVQIQTQHCVMRTMHTQTEPYEALVHDLDVKEWSSAPSISGSTEAGTSTASTIAPSTALSSFGKKDASTDVVTSERPNSKVASLVASLTQPTAATTATTTTLATRSAATSPTTTSPSIPFPSPIDTKSLTTTSTSVSATEPASASADTSSDPAALREELAQLREQNATLQTKVSILQRDLAAETRARNRTAVAMQDTRDKFEMLSAMAYKKLKEMIFQRHVLEMEIRELRAQVDMHSEVNVVREGEILYRQEQQHQQQMMHQQQQQQHIY